MWLKMKLSVSAYKTPCIWYSTAHILITGAKQKASALPSRTNAAPSAKAEIIEAPWCASAVAVLNAGVL
jgi:hypothetical protein